MDVRGQIVTGPLKDVSIAYKNPQFVGDEVFPIIDTSDPKMNVYEYLKGDWFRDEAQIRARGTRAQRGTFKLKAIPYSTKEYAFASEVTAEDRRDAASLMAPPLQPDQDAIELCANKIDLSKERRIAAIIKATAWCGVSAGGEDAAGLWAATDSTNTFIEDVETRKQTILSATGVMPNRLVIDSGTFAKLKLSSTILDRTKYGGSEGDPAKVTAQMLAALLELERVLVGASIYSSAKEKKDGTDFTAAPIWQQNSGKGMAFLYYRPPKIGLKIPMPGVQVRLKYEGGSIRRTTTWQESAEHQDVYEVAEETDIIATGSYLGFMWQDTLAT